MATIENPKWLSKDEYPFKPHFFEINGEKLHYIDEGQGDVILFVHGTPSWSFDFRKQIKVLSKSYRCIAIDHIGFGLSSKPKNYNYSTIEHSSTLQKFITFLKLEKLSIVVHDFGGPIGLNFAINNPDKIEKIIILNSWLWSSKSDPDFIKFSKILKSPLLPILYKYFNFSPSFILPSSFGDKKLNSKIKKYYTLPFAKIQERQGPLAFAKSLLTDQDWFEELWNKKIVIENKKVLFVWGMKDPVIKPKYLSKFELAFKNSTSIKLDSCGHFPQEEEADIVSKSILAFLQE